MADHLDLSVCRLGRRVGLARQNGTGGGLGIDRVALAALSPELAIGSIDLDDAATLRDQRPAQACAIGAGAFDAEGLDAVVTGIERASRRAPSPEMATATWTSL
jgi:hypothetical protein